MRLGEVRVFSQPLSRGLSFFFAKSANLYIQPMVANKHERVSQIYNWYRTARLNVLYYEESLRRWTRAVQIHDVLIALSGSTSPIAFWQRSTDPLYKQFWFYLTLISGLLAILKPIIKWEKKLTLFSELHTHYCDLYMDLKILSENIAADADLSSKNDSLFQHYRDSFKGLERKEPPQDDAKVFRLQQKVNREINISKHWYPPES